MISLKNNRPKAFWGALISAGTGLVNSLIGGIGQRDAAEEQARLQRLQTQNQLASQNAQNVAATLNNYAAVMANRQNDELVFKRGGKVRRKRLRNEVNITDGGVAIPVGNDTFLLRGASHQDVNETGQTGIGINVNGKEIEAENGEVLQVRDKDARVFSAQPILDGVSPAEAVLAGANKNQTFSAQESRKSPRRRNKTLACGGRVKAKWGLRADGTYGEIPDLPSMQSSSLVIMPWSNPETTVNTTVEEPLTPLQPATPNRLAQGNPWYGTPSSVPTYTRVEPNRTSQTQYDDSNIRGLKPGVAYGINTGLDMLGSIGSAIITNHFLRDSADYYKDYAIPEYQDEMFVPGDTRVYTGARQAELRNARNRAMSTIGRNTASSNTAVSRMQDVNQTFTENINKLWEDAANQNLQLRNANTERLQQVLARNAAARNKYYENVANARNTLLQSRINNDLLRGQNWANMFGNITQAAENGIQNYLDYQTNGANIALATIPYLNNNRNIQSVWDTILNTYGRGIFGGRRTGFPSLRFV